jgi:putative FmdB family regulatory protein
MPYYEYTCSACGRGFNLQIRTGSRRAAIPCPQCGEVEARTPQPAAPAVLNKQGGPVVGKSWAPAGFYVHGSCKDIHLDNCRIIGPKTGLHAQDSEVTATHLRVKYADDAVIAENSTVRIDTLDVE